MYRPLRERDGRHTIDGSRSSTRATPSLSARRHAKTARPPAWRFVLVEAIRARALQLRLSRYAGVLDRLLELGWGTGWSVHCVHSPPFARCDAHFVDDLGGSQRYVLAVRVSSRVRLRGTWRVLGRRDDLGALEAERRLLAQVGWARERIVCDNFAVQHDPVRAYSRGRYMARGAAQVARVRGRSRKIIGGPMFGPRFEVDPDMCPHRARCDQLLRG